MLATMLLFVLSARLVMPILGKDAMPPMDTGVLAGSLQLDSNLSYHQVKKIAKEIIQILEEERKKGLERYAIYFGIEPGVITVGGGSNVQNANLVITYVDRFHRKETIWQIEHRLMKKKKKKKKISQLPGVKSVNLYAQGATPLSSINGTVDTIIMANYYKILFPLGEKLYNAYYNIKGASSVKLS
jgi:multidrug efflux pump subunit AcrB